MPKKKKIVPIKQQKEKPDYKIYGVRKEEEFVKFDRELPAPLEWWVFSLVRTARIRKR